MARQDVYGTPADPDVGAAAQAHPAGRVPGGQVDGEVGGLGAGHPLQPHACRRRSSCAGRRAWLAPAPANASTSSPLPCSTATRKRRSGPLLPSTGPRLAAYANLPEPCVGTLPGSRGVRRTAAAVEAGARSRIGGPTGMPRSRTPGCRRSLRLQPAPQPGSPTGRPRSAPATPATSDASGRSRWPAGRWIRRSSAASVAYVAIDCLGEVTTPAGSERGPRRACPTIARATRRGTSICATWPTPRQDQQPAVRDDAGPPARAPADRPACR